MQKKPRLRRKNTNKTKIQKRKIDFSLLVFLFLFLSSVLYINRDKIFTDTITIDGAIYAPVKLVQEPRKEIIRVSYNIQKDYNTAKKAVHDNSELLCLAYNIFFEARGTSEDEMIRVINVTTNRVKDKRYPSTYCGVVTQYKAFSWTLDKSKHDVRNTIRRTPSEIYSWRKSLKMAEYELTKGYKDRTHGAYLYHANYMKPKWNFNIIKVTTKSQFHTFYKDKNI